MRCSRGRLSGGWLMIAWTALLQMPARHMLICFTPASCGSVICDSCWGAPGTGVDGDQPHGRATAVERPDITGLTAYNDL